MKKILLFVAIVWNVQVNGMTSAWVDQNGNCLVAWDDYASRTGGSEIYGQYYRSGSQTPTWQSVLSGNGEDFNPMVALSKSGTGVVVWLKADASCGCLAIYYAMFNKNSGWTQEQRLTVSKETVMGLPKISVNDDQVVLSWTAAFLDSQYSQSRLAFLHLGSTWLGPLTLTVSE